MTRHLRASAEGLEATHNNEPPRRAFVPVDLPDPEPNGPTIWAAREVRRDEPTVNLWPLVRLLAAVVFLIGAVLTWGLS